MRTGTIETNNSRARASLRCGAGIVDESDLEAEIKTATTTKRIADNSWSVNCRFMFRDLFFGVRRPGAALARGGPKPLW